MSDPQPKWLVVIDRPYYPDVYEFTDRDEAQAVFDTAPEREGDETGRHDCKVYLVRVEAEAPFQSHH